jgi:hypothetical protein
MHPFGRLAEATGLSHGPKKEQVVQVYALGDV